MPPRQTTALQRSAAGALAALMGCSSGGTADSAPPEAAPTAGPAGTFELAFEHDGVDRTALVYVPETHDPAADPALVLNLHGFGGRAADHMLWADLRPLADRDGFVAVWPQGSDLEGDPHWNAALESPDNKSGADDLGFLRELVARVDRTYPVDRDRVHAVGYSNGGMMAFALACYASDLVASVGVVSGQLLDASSTCAPTHPTAVITLHGTADGVIPYEGDGAQLGAQDALDFWVAANEADPTPATDRDESGGLPVERQVWSGGRGGVAVEDYRCEGGEHVWFEETYAGSDASALVWDFVTAYDIDGAR